MDICLYFSGVGRGIKQSKLNRSLLEYGVQIQAMVTRLIVMLASPASSPIPNQAYLIHISRLLPVHLI